MNQIHPQNKLKIFWDSILGVLIIISIVRIPYRIAFNIQMGTFEAVTDDIFDIINKYFNSIY